MEYEENEHDQEKFWKAQATEIEGENRRVKILVRAPADRQR